MATMDALLRIKADVQGEGQVASLGRALGGVGQTANRVTGSLRGLTAAAGMGGLAGAMGTLAPLLSVAGLGSMAKSALDAGNTMFDLAQKTGMSVESLARFKKAAATSDTDLETVAKASMKLSKGMLEAAETGKGATSEALQAMGISATDAAGKLKSADEVMLEIATRFKAMPDGAEKTAMAMKLFGRSGAELVPLLNMGGDAIDKLKVKMTTAFAEKANQYSDKLATLSGKVGALGMDIMVAVLPALDSLTSALTKVVDAFNSVDPSIRNVIVLASLIAIAWGPITGLITGIVAAFSSLGTLPAIIAGFAGAAAPAVAAITAAFSGLLAWLTGTLLPGLIAFFSGPVGWTVLAVAAVVAMAIAFREPILEFVKWIGENLAPIGKFFSDLWASILDNGSKFLTTLGELFSKGLAAALELAYKVFVEPWVKLFDTVLREPISKLLTWVRDTFRAPFEAVVNFVRGIFNGLLQNIGNGINSAIGMVNRLIGAYNSLPAPDLPFVPTVSIPQFATGGVVTRPTVAMVGEGGEPEYIIPQSKMLAASARYLAGTRGAGVLSGGSPSGAPRLGRSQINITTGPVLQQDGRQWVTMADLVAATQATEDAILDQLRTFGGRRAAGIA